MKKRFGTAVNRHRARAMINLSFACGSRGDSTRSWTLKEVSMIHLNHRSSNLIHDLVETSATSNFDAKVGGELLTICDSTNAPYCLKIRTLVGKDPSEVKSWKIHFIARSAYPHLCPFSSIGVLFLTVFGSECGEIDFSSRKNYWDLGLLPSFSKKQLSNHIQRQDIVALVKLLDIQTVKITHGFRYAAERLLLAMGIPQGEIDKQLGWTSKQSTGGRVYGRDSPSGILII